MSTFPAAATPTGSEPWPPSCLSLLACLSRGGEAKPELLATSGGRETRKTASRVDEAHNTRAKRRLGRAGELRAPIEVISARTLINELIKIKASATIVRQGIRLIFGNYTIGTD